MRLHEQLARLLARHDNLAQLGHLGRDLRESLKERGGLHHVAQALVRLQLEQKATDGGLADGGDEGALDHDNDVRLAVVGRRALEANQPAARRE